MLLYYTHNKKPRGFMERCYFYHRMQAEQSGHKFVAVVAEPFDDTDIILPFNPDPKYSDIYTRIIVALESVPDDEPVYLVEDDTLYPLERYSWALPDPEAVVYNLNLCYIGEGGFTWHMRGGIALSQLMGSCSAVRRNIRMKLEATLAGQMACIEPCSGQERPYQSMTCSLSLPSVDFRTAYNASWALPDDVEYFDQLEGWGSAKELWNCIYKGGK